MTASGLPEGFVTIEELEDARHPDTASKPYTAYHYGLAEMIRQRIAVREVVLDISEAIWCEQEGYHEVIELEPIYALTGHRTAIWHPPTHGGWVMVPRELDDEMRGAGASVIYDYAQDCDACVEAFPDAGDAFAKAYAAAIAAAPLPGGV